MAPLVVDPSGYLKAHHSVGHCLYEASEIHKLDTQGDWEWEPDGIAFLRAWEALAAVDQTLAEAGEAAPIRPIRPPDSESWEPTEPTPENEIAARKHLESLLRETVAGSPAYTAFRESFRESCA